MAEMVNASTLGRLRNLLSDLEVQAKTYGELVEQYRTDSFKDNDVFTAGYYRGRAGAYEVAQRQMQSHIDKLRTIIGPGI